MFALHVRTAFGLDLLFILCWESFSCCFAMSSDTPVPSPHGTVWTNHGNTSGLTLRRIRRGRMNGGGKSTRMCWPI